MTPEVNERAVGENAPSPLARPTVLGERLPTSVGGVATATGWAGACFVLFSLQAQAAPDSPSPTPAAASAAATAGLHPNPRARGVAPVVASNPLGMSPEVRPAPPPPSSDLPISDASTPPPPGPTCPPPLRLAYDAAARRPRHPSRPALAELAAAAEALPDARFVVEGHADAPGSHFANLAMSHARAARILEELVDLGVPRERIDVQAYGEYRPLPGLPKQDPANRRVEIRVRSPRCPSRDAP